MKILFPYSTNKMNGPEKWRQDLVNELSKDNDVLNVATNKISFIFNIFKVHKVDVLHIYNQSITNFGLIFLAKIFRKKIVYTLHGDYYSEYFNKKGVKKILWMPVNNLLVKLVNVITFPSNYLQNLILSKQPELSKKCMVIPNGLDFSKIEKKEKYSKEKIGLNNNDFLIVEITNFNYIKKAEGIVLLIKAFKKVLAKNKNSRLFIIGGGRYLDLFKNKYESPEIKFLGFRNDAISYLKCADLFIHISFLDNFPYVVLESVTCGIPTIINDFGGMKEIVKNVEATTKNDHKDLHKKIEKIQKDEDFKKKIIKKENNYK